MRSIEGWRTHGGPRLNEEAGVYVFAGSGVVRAQHPSMVWPRTSKTSADPVELNAAAFIVPWLEERV